MSMYSSTFRYRWIRISLADPSADIAQLRRDAVDVVTTFICELGGE